MGFTTTKCPCCGYTINFPDDVTQVECPACGNMIQDSAIRSMVSSEIRKPEVTGGDKAWAVVSWFLLIIPGFVYRSQLKQADVYFNKLKAKINHDASQIENFLEQRVVILENLSALINKEMAFERDALSQIASYRNGIQVGMMNMAAQLIGNAETQIKDVFRDHPELMSNSAIEKAIKENDYLQREITAARECYNDSVNEWNSSLFESRAKRVVAAKKGYCTKKLFVTSHEIRSKAREVLF